jgi:conjugal transfer ATP-binding protein TraC
MGTPVLLTWGRRGQAQHIDLFANTAGNYNATVTGASGSGKSTFMNAMGLANLECGGQNFIIDVGRSYEKQVQLLKGQYLVFNQSSNVCLNPLDLIDSIAEDAEMAGAVIAQMASPNHPLSAYQTTRIEDAIKLLFELKQQGEIEWMSIDHLAELLIHNRCLSNEAPFDRRQDERLCDMNIREIGISLGRYCANGVYGAWFNGRNNIRFNANLVVLELEELGQFPDLQAVVMLILMQQITGTMYLGDRSVRKLFMIDEAWDLFKKGSMMAAGIEKAYRRARKYGGSCITGTQSIQDYFANPATLAAFQSSDWMFMLRQKEDAIVSLMNSGQFILNEYELSLFRSLKTVSGQYSEVLVRCAGQAFVGRHILSPRDLLLFSSKAEDFVAVKNYNDQGFSMDQAIERVLQDRGLVSG